MVEIRWREVPEQHVVTETRTVDQTGLQAWLSDAMAVVAERAGMSGGPLGTADWPFLQRPDHPNEPLFIAIYEGDLNAGPAPVEVCATVASGGDRTIPAHREAYARITKSLVTGGGLGEVYQTIAARIAADGLAVARAPRETYWSDFLSAAADDDVFDIAFPVT